MNVSFYKLLLVMKYSGWCPFIGCMHFLEDEFQLFLKFLVYVARNGLFGILVGIRSNETITPTKSMSSGNLWTWSLLALRYNIEVQWTTCQEYVKWKLMNMEPTSIEVRHWGIMNYLSRVCQVETCEHQLYWQMVRLGLSKLAWCTHFVLGIMLTSILTCCCIC
jgi:hypothetical protein